MATKVKHLLNRNGRYFARLVVPKEIRPFLDNKTELREPLGPDRRAAIAAHYGAMARLQAKIAVAERAMRVATGSKMIPGRYPLSVEQMAVRSYNDLIKFDEDARNTDHRYAGIGDVDATEVCMLRDGMAGRLRDDELQALIGHRIEWFRRLGNTTAEYGSDEWRTLARAMCISEHEFMSRMVERDEGNFTGKPEHPLLAKAIEADPTTDVREADFNALTFEDVIQEHERVTGMGIGGREKANATLKKYRNAVFDFEHHRRSKRVATVTLEEAEAWRDAMLTAGKLSRKTVKDKITAIRTIIGWAQKQSRGKLYPKGIPLEHIDLPVADDIDSAERTYSLKEARHLLETVRNANRPSFRWIPWIIAHTGARVNEITPLEKADVFEVEGRWFIHIRVGDGRTTKTHKGRKVPVHPALIKEGFIDFVNSQTDGKLFPGGKHEDNRLREWIKENVFPNHTDMPPPNHGFRHLFEDALFGDVSHKAALYITGRASGDSADSYGGSDLKLLELARQMDKVKPII